jgi:hypothetical protein
VWELIIIIVKKAHRVNPGHKSKPEMNTNERKPGENFNPFSKY